MLNTDYYLYPDDDRAWWIEFENTPSTDKKNIVIAYVNVTNRKQIFRLDLKKEKLAYKQWKDIITKNKYKSEERILEFPLNPYDIGWLKPV